ncbi:Predicted lipid carrier protein YhbT, contains SCP2 domain [Rhodovulum sp. ES.010]|uniref:ubiquinone anaerobic biosynthesis accessory factor UbiT n=1 Tax=Rhodovulum sp. ES.010 TaxID=1882821 RepID=UPI00092AF1B4|nr:SCP2 sterol-binding domain-containing protein [Rhodovulum sp. ES.010]SIO57445.1 Predicted lipid carrier protein YhbT, contains SCP2 domain [Rhodovulum sp. ES.010]
MTTEPQSSRAAGGTGGFPFAPPLPLFLLTPILGRVVHRIARQNPDMFDRLGPHRHAYFLIDPVDMPFMLYLRPDPEALEFRAVNRRNPPPAAARISGTFLDLLTLMDTEQDGDALFFSRDLIVTGDTEAVVCLRNALDDVDDPIAESVADMFGPPGRAALNALRRAAENAQKRKGA